MKKRKAIFEVKFNLDDIIDQEWLKKDFNGNELKMMKWLWKEEGMGIFDKNMILVAVKKIV